MECKVKCKVKCEVWSKECAVQCVKSKVKCRVWSVKCKVWCVECRVKSGKSRVRLECCERNRNINANTPLASRPWSDRGTVLRIREKRHNGKAVKKLEHRGKHIEKNMDPKLNGEQCPLGFGARQFAEQKRFQLGSSLN